MYILKEEIKTELDQTYVFCIPVNWAKKERELLTKTIFEELQAIALSIVEKPLATIFGVGVITGMVIDIDYDVTSMCCLV